MSDRNRPKKDQDNHKDEQSGLEESLLNKEKIKDRFNKPLSDARSRTYGSVIATPGGGAPPAEHDREGYARELRNTLIRYPSLPNMTAAASLSSLGTLRPHPAQRRASDSYLDGEHHPPGSAPRVVSMQPEGQGLLERDLPRGGTDNDDVPPPSYHDIMRSEDFVPYHERRADASLPKPSSYNDVALDTLSSSNTGAEITETDGGDQNTSNRSGRGHEAGGPFPKMWRCCGSFGEWLQNRLNTRRGLLIVGGSVGVLGLLLFLTLFPVSFVYVEYNQIALAKSRTTGNVYEHPTYYPGCYVLTPDRILVRFNATGHLVYLPHVEVFSRTGLSLTLSLSFVYFLRGEELGLLYDKYEDHYSDVITSVAETNIKLTASEISIDNLRLNRHDVTQRLHQQLQLRLGGNCCRENCDFQLCNFRCTFNNCSQSLHVDVKLLYLTEVSIPSEVTSRYTRALLLQVELEKARLDQQKILIEKETQKAVEAVELKAAEILANATAQEKYIEETAAATAQKTTESALFSGWKDLCDRLDLTNEDHRLSVLFIKYLREKDNLLKGVGFPDLSRYV